MMATIFVIFKFIIIVYLCLIGFCLAIMMLLMAIDTIISIIKSWKVRK